MAKVKIKVSDECAEALSGVKLRAEPWDVRGMLRGEISCATDTLGEMVERVADDPREVRRLADKIDRLAVAYERVNVDG